MRRTCHPDATHHEGCPCHEQGWSDDRNRWRERSQAAERERDAALARVERLAEDVVAARRERDDASAEAKRLLNALHESREEVALMRQEIESQERAHAEVIARHVALHRYNQRAHSGCVAARAKLHQALRHTGLMRGDLVREAIELLAVGTGLPVQN